MLQAIQEIHRTIDDEERAACASLTREEKPEGILFGKYIVSRFLGVGGFAKVYEASDVVTKQSVAIKIVSKSRLVEACLTTQIEREVSIMRRLNHPHIVKLYEVLASKTKIYLVMELAKGGELYEELVKGLLSESVNRRCFQQLISAVQHCHDNGVFHRDLKLDNLLLDEDFNIKVSDFGLSATKEHVRSDGMLHTLCGTPAYVAPEMLGKNGYDGAKVDVWQCGVVLFVLTTGSMPFKEPDTPTLLRRISHGQVRFPRGVQPDVKRLIQRMLDPNPRTRITIAEILQDPWFRQGYREIKVKQKNPEWEDEDTAKSLNAFHLISLSSGLDMSRLFITKPDPEAWDSVERIVSKQTAERILDTVDEVADPAIVTVKRKEDGWGTKLEGHNGNFVILIGIYRLTDELVVIEVKKEGETGSQFWTDKLRPRMLELEHKP